jgi:branched-chain amino acid transport system permease protein
LFLVLGLGPGAVYAGLGLGLVLTYRGSGVLNLAHGAMAMYSAYVYAELRSSGNLVLPGVPGTHHLGNVGAAPALAMALVVAALLGLIAHVLIFGRLQRRGAPALASVVATVGLMLALQAVVTLRFGTSPQAVGAVLPQQGFVIAGTRVPVDRVYLAALLVVAAAATTAVYRSTRFGLASRAAAESETGAALLGFSPALHAGANWVIGSLLAGLFGILLGPIAGVDPTTYTFLVVPALVAALAGRLASTWWTVAAGLALGVLQSELTRVHMPWQWLGAQALKEVLPFVALAIVLIMVGTPVPRRGAPRAGRLPAAAAPARPGRVTVGIVAVGAIAIQTLDGSYRSAVTVTMIGVILCLSVVVLTGFAGQISLAQMSFAGIAGFILSRLVESSGIPFPIGPLLAALAAGACGVVIGVPALRARGVSFAVITLGAGLAVEALIFQNLSNGILATNSVPPARLGTIDLGPVARDGTPRAAFGFLVLAVVAAVSLSVMRLRRSRLGRQMLAVRADERAATASGVNVAATKLIAFGTSAFIAGLAGTLIGYHQGALSDQSFSIFASLALLAAAYLGGIGSVAGAFVGGLLIPGGIVSTVGERALSLGRYQTLVSGLAVVAAAVANPEGIASKVRLKRR